MTFRELRQKAEQLVQNLHTLSEEALNEAIESTITSEAIVNAKAFREIAIEEYESRINDEVQERLGQSTVSAIQHYNQYLSIKIGAEIVFDRHVGFKFREYTSEEKAEHWSGVIEDCF
jgi:hypothetical protein